MKPNAVGQIAAELAVATRQPGRQPLERVVDLSPALFRDRAARILRLQRQCRFAAGPGSACPCEVNDLVAVDLVQVQPVAPDVVDLLAGDVAEEGRQAEVIVLRPDIERVIVAARALQANSQKHLAHALGGGHRVAVGAVKARGRVFPGRAQAGDDPPHQRIQRRIASDLVAQPALEDPGALLAHRFFFVAQQVSPLECPEVGKLGPLDQAIDQLAHVSRGSLSARNDRASSGSGSRPIASRNARRRKTESLQMPEGLIRIALSLAKTGSSNGPFAGSTAPDEVGPIGQKREPGGPAAVHVANAHGRLAAALTP